MSTPSDGGAGAGSGPAANEPRPAAPPTGRRASWSSRKPAQAAPVYIACYLAIALIGGQVVGWIRPPLVAGIVVTLMGAAVLLISLLLVLSICRVAMHPHRELAWILGMSILFSLVRPSVCAFVGKWLGFPAAGMQIAKALSIVVAPGMALLLGNAVLMVWAAFLGKFVSRVIREGKLILPVAAGLAGGHHHSLLGRRRAPDQDGPRGRPDLQRDRSRRSPAQRHRADPECGGDW